MPFKCIELFYLFFQKKKIFKKICVCLPYLKFQIPYPKPTYFFIWPKRYFRIKETMFCMKMSRWLLSGNIFVSIVNYYIYFFMNIVDPL